MKNIGTPKYRIGKISELTNVPQQTLRYYEELGLIKPEKSQNTGYRYYDSYVLNELLYARTLRSMGFSMEQTGKFLNMNDLNDNIMLCEENEEKIESKIRMYQIMLQSTKEYKERMKNCCGDKDRFVIKDRPDIVLQCYQHKQCIQASDGVEDFAILNKRLNDWLHILPEVSTGFVIDYESINEMKSPEDIDYWWGFTIPMEVAIQHHMDVTFPNNHIKSCPCVYTTFEVEKHGAFIQEFYQKVYLKLMQAGHVIVNHIIGRVITRTYENGSSRHMYEIWIPIAEQ